MPLVTSHSAVKQSLLAGRDSRWRQMLRIEDVGGGIGVARDALFALQPERVVYAEGDSWFDKFTPLPHSDTNLLAAIRTPFLTAVVDVAHIGDEVRDMVRGHQARQTEAMFELLSFDAILLSGGGNDLKNLFADRFAQSARASAGLPSAFPPEELARLQTPSSFRGFFDDVMASIRRFVDLRDHAGDARTRQAPIFVHGYDYLQPRPAGALVFAGSRIGSGPWLYPPMKAAGLSPAQMRSTADAVIDEMNIRLATEIAGLDKVFVIDQRGLLTPAAAETQGDDADWMDEIHPNAGGFRKLARNRWDVPMATLGLGWRPADGDLEPALPVSNASTALAEPDAGARRPA